MNNISLLDTIQLAIVQVQIMIDKADQQQIRNFETSNKLKDLLLKIQSSLVERGSSPSSLIRELNYVYGQIFRALEGSKLESYLDIILADLNSE